MEAATVREHLEWMKKRDLDLLDQGDLRQAFMSVISDLGKHDGTRDHPMIRLGTQMLEAGYLDTSISMRKFVEGF